MNRRRVASIAIISLVLAPHLRATAHEFTLTGGRLLTEDGNLATGLAVVVSEGRITRVAGAQESDLPAPVEFPPEAVIAPGLIDVGSTIALHGRNASNARPLDPAANARAAIDPTHRDFSLAVENGITSATVCPAPVNVISGLAATCRTMPRPDGLDFLRVDGPLVISLGSQALRRDREPTSRGGALSLLRAALAEAQAGGGSSQLRAFVAGHLPGLVFCETAADMRAALDVLAGTGTPLALIHDGDAPLPDFESLLPAASERTTFVLGPFDFDTPERALRVPGVLARAGARVAFRGGLPQASRHSLRVAAHLAVRYGMEPAPARRALTIDAAHAAGVAERVGTLSPGKDADVVVYSSDPLRLDARVLAVFSRGSRVRLESTTGGRE